MNRSLLRPLGAPPTAKFCVAFLLFALSRAGLAAPDFVVDGYARELENLIVASDRAGEISALEVLFYLDAGRNPLAKIASTDWLAPVHERSIGASQDIDRAIAEYRAARSLAGNLPPTAPTNGVLRALLHSACEAAWIDNGIMPDIKIERPDIDLYYIANTERYVQKRRAQVRYIFFGDKPDRAVGEASPRAELENLRSRINAGDIGFQSAAIRHSQAPSARDGGAIPAFSEGTHFEEFERQAFSLDGSGELSRVFEGNGGFYLIQMVKKEEGKALIPRGEAEADIRKQLRHQHVRPYYYIALGDLRRDAFVRNYSTLWDYADEQAPVAQVAGRKLSREELMRANPNVINANYEVQWSTVLGEAQAWVEGELVMSEMERRGWLDHRYISMAKRAVRIHVTAQDNLRDRVDRSRFSSPEAALAVLRSGGSVKSGVPESRIIGISVAPTSEDRPFTGRRLIRRRKITELGAKVHTGVLPLESGPIEFAESLASAAASGDTDLKYVIRDMRERIAAEQVEEAVLEIKDLGWQNTLPGVTRYPSVAGKEPGEIGEPERIGERLNIYYVAAVRSGDSGPLLDAPMALEIAAFEREAQRIFEDEVAKVLPK